MRKIIIAEFITLGGVNQVARMSIEEGFDVLKGMVKTGHCVDHRIIVAL